MQCNVLWAFYERGGSKNLVGSLEMPVEFFISLYISMTYEKHRKRNLKKTSKKLKFLEVTFRGFKF